MTTNKTVLAIALGLMLGSAAGAQVITYNPRTGDIGLDQQLGYMNDYGRRNRDYFADDIVSGFGAPRYLVNDLLTRRNWSPGDVYYACGLAYQLRRPCSDVAREYESNRGQGWGAIAKRMGIKPGSAEFHALKGQMGKSKGRFEAYRGDVHHEGRDYDDHDGKSDKGKSGKGWSDEGDQGKSGHGDKDKSGDKGKGNGNGKKG